MKELPSNYEVVSAWPPNYGDYAANALAFTLLFINAS